MTAVEKIRAAASNGLTRAEIVATVLNGQPMTAEEKSAYSAARGLWKLREAKRKSERRATGAKSAVQKNDEWRDRKCDVKPEIVASIPNINRKRVARGTRSLYDFICTYCVGSIAEFPPPKEMKPLLDQMEKVADAAGLYQIQMSRGFGKTTFISALGIYRIVKGDSHFIEIIGATSSKAKDIFDTMLGIFTADEFAQDFPQISVPVRRSGMNSIRMMSQTYDHQLTEMEKRADRFIFPRIPDVPYSEAKIIVKGFSSKDLRGVNIKAERPDLIFLDDIQDDNMAESPERIAAAVKKIHATIRGQFAHMKSGTILMTATPIFPGDLSDRIKDDPGWVTKIYPMMISMPSNMALWEKYGEIIRSEVAALAVGVKPEKRSIDFYREHRAELDAGAKPHSPHIYTRGRELSAIQHAMNIIYSSDNGLDVFMSEYQMQPRRSSSAEYSLTFREVLRALNGHPMFSVPVLSSRYVVATIDVMNDAGLRWAITAFGNNRVAAVVAYGRYPETGRIYPENASREDQSSLIAEALDELVVKIRGVRMFIDGKKDKPIKVSAIGIDAGWKPQAVQAVAAVHKRDFDGGIFTMRGQSWKDYRPSSIDGRKRSYVVSVDEWADLRVGKYGEYIAFHSDFWCETAQLAWLNSPLTPGSISLFGDRPDPHKIFADEVTADQLVSKDKTRSGEEMWKWNIAGANHMGDCVKMAFVLAYWKRVYKTYQKQDASNLPSVSELPGIPRKVTPTNDEQKPTVRKPTRRFMPRVI